MAAGTIGINSGTNLGVASDSVGGTYYGIGKIDISPVGASGTLFNGTVGVSTLPNLPQGSIQVTAGTIGSDTIIGGTLQNLVSGTINNVGTVPGVGVVSVLSKGTIALGSFGGIDANAVAQTGNPAAVGGTDSGGTIRTIKVDSGGLQRIGIDSGTISQLPNLPQGSINVTAGTIAALGTMGTLGTVSNIGSITNLGQVYNAGTLQGGTINTGTVVMTNGTIGAGTVKVTGPLQILGDVADGGTSASNPVRVGGTNSGGTLRGLLVNDAGAANIGTLNNGTVVMPSGTITTIAAGTLGTLSNLGSVTNVGQVYNAGTIQGGTINLGTFVANGGSVAITDNTNIVNILGNAASNGTGAQKAMLMGGAFAEFSGSSLGAGTDIIASFDASNFRSFNLQLLNTWVGTVQIQYSNDNSNFGTGGAFAISNTATQISTNLTSNNNYIGNVMGRYMRVRVNTYTSGTVQGILEMYTYPVTYHSMGASVAQSGAWNIGTLGTIGSGTLGTITNVGQVYNAGTLQAGTINTGTFRADARTTQNIVSFGTQIANTGAAAATIVGSASVGAGTYLWLQDVSVINPNANTTCILGFGTAQQGTNVLFRGNLGTSSASGIEKPFPKMVNAGMTNQDLVFSTTGAGTIDLSISYMISA